MKETQRRQAGGGFTTGEEARQAVPSKLVIIPVGPILPLLNGGRSLGSVCSLLNRCSVSSGTHGPLLREQRGLGLACCGGGGGPGLTG